MRSALVAVALAVSSGTAFAQAWPAPEGTGAVTITYQWIENTGHTLTDGFSTPDGSSRNMSVFVEGDYALTDRFSFTLGLPYVMSKYLDPNPPPPPVPYLPNEICHCWSHGIQDFALTARYNLVNSRFGLTPSVAFGVPTHDYEFRGEAAIGMHLREMRVNLDAGTRLDRISPNLSVQGHYTYAIVEEAAGVSHNRTHLGAEVAYILGRHLSLRGFFTHQQTHGGLRFGNLSGPLLFPGDVNTPERLFQHDRLLKDNNWRVGGGAAYSFPSMDIYATFVDYAKSTDGHSGRLFNFGISIPFER